MISSSREYPCHEYDIGRVDALGAAIEAVLESLALDCERPYTEDAFRVFTSRFNQLEIAIAKSCANREQRRQEYLEIIPVARAVSSQVFHLRSCPPDASAYGQYVEAVGRALNKLVTQSFTPELRQIQIELGLINVLASLFTLDVSKFGYSLDFHPRCPAVRRALGNALINLTYKHKGSKQRLCSHRSFLSHTRKFIAEAPAMAQYYGGVIRNLSWNANEEMVKNLRKIVPTLASCVLAVYDTDRKCLASVLSALWNLASLSRDNQEAMCSVPRFLEALTLLLSDKDPGLVESSSGIIKYLSYYIVQNECMAKYMVEELGLLAKLLRLVGDPASPSNAVSSAFGSICLLAKENTFIAQKLVADKEVNYLARLLNSPREETRSGAQRLLGILQEVSHCLESSMAIPSAGLDPQLTTFATPTLQLPSVHQMDSNYTHQQQFTEYRGGHRNQPALHYEYDAGLCSAGAMKSQQRSTMWTKNPTTMQFYTLPNVCSVFANQGDTPIRSLTGSSAAYNGGRSMSLPRDTVHCGCTKICPPAPVAGVHTGDKHNAGQSWGKVEPEYEQFVTEPVIEAGLDISDSMQCTRSVSAQSLNSTMDPKNISEWPSTVATTSTVDTHNHSPVSESELPASPSECTAVNEHQETSVTAASKRSPILFEAQIEVPACIASESVKMAGFPPDYAVNKRTENNESFELDEAGRDEKFDESLLCDMINTVLPKPKAGSAGWQAISTSREGSSSLLDDSIAAVMPRKNFSQAPCRPATHFPLGTPSLGGNSSHHNVTPNGSLDLIDWDDNMRVEAPTGPCSMLLVGEKKLVASEGGWSKSHDDKSSIALLSSSHRSPSKIECSPLKPSTTQRIIQQAPNGAETKVMKPLLLPKPGKSKKSVSNSQKPKKTQIDSTSALVPTLCNTSK